MFNKISKYSFYIFFFIFLILTSFFFLLKVSANEMTYGWTKSINLNYSISSSIAQGIDITFDNLGNMYLTGIFTGSGDFNKSGLGIADNKNAGSNTGMFLSKYNSDGSYGWTKAITGTSTGDESTSVATDSIGNIFIGGTFYGTKCFDGASGCLTSSNSRDAFIVKYTNTGVFVWARKIGIAGSGKIYQDAIKDIAVDQDDNVYFTGGYGGGSVNFNTTGSGSSDTKVGNYVDMDSSAAFLTKYNADGSYGWTYVSNSAGYRIGKSLAIDSSGNIYVTGTGFSLSKFSSSGTLLSSFGYTGDSLSLDTSGNIYLAKCTTNLNIAKVGPTGTQIYNRTSASFSCTYDKGVGTAVDSDGTLYVIGGFYGTNVNFNFTGAGGTVYRTSNPTTKYNLFLIKYNADNTFGWVRTIGATGINHLFGRALKYDNSGNLYYTGGYMASNNTINFNNTGIGNQDLHTSFVGIFLTKYQTPGNIISEVPAGITPVLADSWDTNVSTSPQLGVQNVGIEDSQNKRIANFSVDFSNSLDWTNLTAESAGVKSVFHYPGGYTSLPGASGSSYILYVPKGDGDRVLICPGADSLSGVSLSCSGGYYLDETSPNVTVAIEGGVTYWKVSGLTGTGGMSVITGLRDTLSRLKVGNVSDHTITFGTNYGLIAGSTDTMVLEFPDFDLSSLTITDIELTDSLDSARTLGSSAGANTWGTVINSGAKTITFTVPTSGTGGYVAAAQIVIKIGLNVTGGANQIVNPSSTGSYKETITLNNTAPGEQGKIDIPIIDSDTVDISGYVTAFIHFDIDTGILSTDNCAYNQCLVHAGTTALAGNYTVDFGELTSAIVNKSQTISNHADGLPGTINSIYFDLTTNAPGGAVVTVKSLNGGLQGPGTNLITSVTDGLDIAANSGLYGYHLPVASTQLHGSIIPNSLCDSSVEFCGALSTATNTVFDTNDLPIDSARVRMDLAAAASYTNNPGLYTDTLTFVATGTF
jgi:hypothetical protein